MHTMSWLCDLSYGAPVTFPTIQWHDIQHGKKMKLAFNVTQTGHKNENVHSTSLASKSLGTWCPMGDVNQIIIGKDKAEL